MASACRAASTHFAGAVPAWKVRPASLVLLPVAWKREPRAITVSQMPRYFTRTGTNGPIGFSRRPLISFIAVANAAGSPCSRT